jgi:uncharacterized protein (TIGR02118 family)
MFKIVGIIKRPEGMDFEAFKTWWLTEHAPKVKQWPGLKKYAINLCTTADQSFDGVAEVWFETKAEMDAVFNTAEGKTARGSATGGASDLAILFTEEHVMVE